MKKALREFLAGVSILVCASAFGADVAGVKVPETTRSGSTELVLNGAGVRTKVFFKVYVLGLYLTGKKTAAADVLAASGPKRVLIHMLRDVDAAEFGTALEEGIKANHGEADIKALAPRLGTLIALMSEMKVAKTGMLIVLDWVPGAGTQVAIDNQLRGKPIPGEDLYHALLRIWLGENPISVDLKKALLGQGG